ncbi:MAG: hypothetical protein ACHQUB_00235 [Candidatus Saccharimonadia bacterium]
MLHSLTFVQNFGGSSAFQIVAERVSASWPWYVIRAAGFIAAGLIIILMLSGIGQVTGLSYRIVEPIKAWAIHKALAIALCVSIAIHVGFLLMDHFIHFSLAQILIPFTSTYNNGTVFSGLALGGVAIALGVLAMYGVVVIVLSSLGWIDSRRNLWHQLHYISYAVALFVFLHALYSGSDLKYGLSRQLWVAIGLVIVVGIISRLWRSGTKKIA